MWPGLCIVANVRHGEAAVERAIALCPDVVFLDIRMPGMTGLKAAVALTEDWPDATPLPLFAFVTAYDQYAVQAFDHAAVDYVLKPVQTDRLKQTCARLQFALTQRARRTAPALAPSPAVEYTVDRALAQLCSLLGTPGLIAPAPNPVAPKLNVIHAAVGTTIHIVPVADVLYFETADKYVRVITAGREYLVRRSLRELLPRLDANQFWQIHRGTVVRADAITVAVRDESGKVTLTLRGHTDKLVASRLYANLFKAM